MAARDIENIQVDTIFEWTEELMGCLYFLIFFVSADPKFVFRIYISSLKCRILFCEKHFHWHILCEKLT